MKRPCDEHDNRVSKKPSFEICPTEEEGRVGLPSDLGESMGEESSSGESCFSDREAGPASDDQEEWPVLQGLVSQLHLEFLYDTAADLLSQLRSQAENCTAREHQRSEDNVRAWVVCAIFLAGHVTGLALEPLLLTRLLQSTGIKLPQFCMHVRHQVSHCGRRQLPAEFSTRLASFQSSSIRLIAMFRKYEKLFNACAQPRLGELAPSVFEAGWVLFLCAKAGVREEVSLHSMLALVLCVLRLLLTSQGAMDGVGAIALLCASDPSLSDEAFVARVLSLQQQHFSSIIYNLRALHLVSFERTEALDLFHASHLQRNQYNLNVYYETLLVELSSSKASHPLQLDERVFLPPRASVPTVAEIKVALPLCRANSWPSSEPQEFTASLPYPPSSFPSSPHTSPLHRPLESVTWLSSKFATAGVGASADLRQLLGTELEAAVAANVQKHEPYITFGSSEFSAVNEQRRELTVKLYYYLLENMLIAEQRSNSTTVRRPWIKSTCFHNCLLACCFEVVIFAFKANRMEFPAVLHAFSLTSWDFFKVVESAVRHGGFPRPVKAHLRDVESLILEKLAWVETEKLPFLLHSYEVKDLLKQQSLLSAVGTPISSSPVFYTAGLHFPPLLPLALPPAHSGEPPELQPQPLSSGDRFSLSLFIRKLMALASDRLEFLCSEALLKIPPNLLNLVWALIHHILTDQPELLVNRHLDTLILCSIYAVCSKIAKMDLKFRRIIAVYVSRYDHNSHEVTRAIYTKVNENPLNIVEFYNNFFIHQTKVFLLREIKPAFLHSTEQSNTRPAVISSPSSSPILGSRRAVSSPSRTSQWSSVYTSPLRERRIAPATEVSLTPMSRALYAFSETPKVSPSVPNVCRSKLFQEDDSDATESDGSERP